MSEEEKIRKAKRRMSRLNKKYEEIIDKLGYLRATLKDYTRLEHRSMCPLCESKINRAYYEKKIPEIKNKIKFLEIWIDQNYNYSKRCRIGMPLILMEDTLKKQKKQEILKYLSENRSVINKAIRTFELPNIKSNDEKVLWNEAIQFQLDKKGMEENDDLEFEILI